MTFDSIAVFGLDEKHDQTIIVHPNSVPANAKGGNPIDAGNYYLNKGGYGGDDNVIAAHEYGHLLGIDDEYSQSNEMLNALLHRAAPRTRRVPRLPWTRRRSSRWSCPRSSSR